MRLKGTSVAVGTLNDESRQRGKLIFYLDREAAQAKALIRKMLDLFAYSEEAETQGYMVVNLRSSGPCFTMCPEKLVSLLKRSVLLMNKFGTLFTFSGH